ncbi:MAG: pyruvate dehydrogenase (acetyl-transferring) E1 component subunit alpha [Desulfobulbus sp.]|nr:pyruvate dehydrogenase (acetyl-transferring) E1 component subunit alpha [Desulfobulbus sp.]
MQSEINKNHAFEQLRQMLLIRRFEEKSAELYSAGKIRGFLHLYIGEEAVAVGVMTALGPEDAVVATYREHGQALARGLSAGSIMAEMYGKVEGCCRGRGGSMHLFDAATRFYGGNAIVAGHLPLAIGLALADTMQHRNRVTCCFFGDGAVAEGDFHEAMNLASLWKLPVLFLCENNLYAMGTAIRYTQASPDIAAKGGCYNMAAAFVDGMDVMAVEAAALKAVAHIREGNGPYLLECRTYRFRAHSMFDSEQYRTREEVEQWKKRDPLVLLTRRMRSTGVLTEEDLVTLEESVAREVSDAEAYAESGSYESVKELTRFVTSHRRRA